ncbi:MAG: SBBP repeat-containing protein [Flavobacteriales bacterium]
MASAPHRMYRASLTVALAIAMLLTRQTHAQLPQLAWAQGLSGVDWDEGRSVTTDTDGNVICGGYFKELFDADPGPGVATLTSEGGKDAFVTKLDSAGNFLWAIQLGNSEDDICNVVKTDPDGNIYVGGSFFGEIDFDHGPGEHVLTSGIGGVVQDGFLMKLDPAGDLLWAVNFGGIGSCSVQALAISSDDEVYLTGYFDGFPDFDPSIGVVELQSVSMADVFVLKLGSSGDLIWAHGFGGGNNDLGYAIAVDANGDIVFTGHHSVSVDLDPGPDEYMLTGDNDVFVAKWTANGDFIWAKAFTGPGNSYGYGIATDQAANVLVTGYFRNDTDFDPSASGTYILTPPGDVFDKSCFVAKLDSDGALVWAKQFGYIASQESHAIAVDDIGNVYTTGSSAFGDFDPGPDPFIINDPGNGGAFVSKLDADGNFLWAVNLGGPGSDEGYGIALDHFGNVFTTGFHGDNADFDPGPDISILPAVGGRDVFVAKLEQGGVGISEAAVHSSPTLYPTAVRGRFMLVGLEFAARIDIFSTSGALVRSEVPRADQLTLDVQEFPSGIYLLAISSKHGGRQVGKFVVE